MHIYNFLQAWEEERIMLKKERKAAELSRELDKQRMFLTDKVVQTLKNIYTIDRDIFAGKLFRLKIFCVV